jgi:hypothetical protein
MPGCSSGESATYRYLPSEYLDAIEMKAFDLVQAYQHPASRIDAERLLTGKIIIVKDIKITEEIIKASTETYLNWGFTLHVIPTDVSDLNLLKVGNKIDAVGLCQGIPTGKMAVILDQSIIEKAGIIPLPLSDSGEIDGPIY